MTSIIANITDVPVDGYLITMYWPGDADLTKEWLDDVDAWLQTLDNVYWHYVHPHQPYWSEHYNNAKYNSQLFMSDYDHIVEFSIRFSGFIVSCEPKSIIWRTTDKHVIEIIGL